jgi:inosose dehydratase
MLKKKDVKLGIAPIAWTNDDMPDLGAENSFEQCISEMALSGYEGTEIGNKYPKDPKVLKNYLDLRCLSVCNAWFSTFFTSKPMENTVKDFIKHRDFLHKMGAKVIGVSEQGNSIQGNLRKSVLKEKPVFTPGEWEKVIKGLEKLASLAKKKGMTLGYHHHMGTGIQNMEEIDHLLKNTGRDVYLLYDTGHAVFAGIDPVELLNKYVKRINHVHLKDVRKNVLAKVKKNNLCFLDAVREGVFTVPGDGMIDFEPVFDILENKKYRGWFVVEAEQDPAKANPFEYALMARGYIKACTGL